MRKEMAQIPSICEGGTKVEIYGTIRPKIEKWSEKAMRNHKAREVDPFKGFVVKPTGEKTCPNYFKN